MEKFSGILKDLILETGFTVRKLATLSGVSAVQYGKYLQGSIPTIDVAVRIANYFQCSLNYLFGLTLDKSLVEYKNYDLTKFVDRYEKALEENNISHYKFAKANEISESALRHWKYGDIPSVDSLIKISKGLCITIDYLVGRSDSK